MTAEIKTGSKFPNFIKAKSNAEKDVVLNELPYYGILKVKGKNEYWEWYIEKSQNSDELAKKFITNPNREDIQYSGFSLRSDWIGKVAKLYVLKSQKSKKEEVQKTNKGLKPIAEVEHEYEELRKRQKV